MWFTRHKIMMMASVIGLVSVGLILVAVIPIYQNANTVLSKIKTKTSELEALTLKVSILSKLDPSILESRVSVLDNALPPRKDVLLYLSAIDGLSRDLGLTFGGISLVPGTISEGDETKAKAVKYGQLQSLETEIKIRGGKESVYTFLRKIEEVLPLMQIKDIKVAILGEDQYSLTLTLGMLWSDPSSIDVKGPITLFGEEEDKYFNQLAGYTRFESIQIDQTEQGGRKLDLFSPTATTPQP